MPPTNRINQHAKMNFMDGKTGGVPALTAMRSHQHFTVCTLSAKALFVAPFGGFIQAADLDGYVKVGAQCGDDLFVRPPRAARLV